MADKKKKAKPSDLGSGGARKAADAIAGRKKKIDDASGSSSYTSPPQSAKSAMTLDFSQKGATSRNSLEAARADMLARKNAKKK
jgi:hypothetical protein